MTKKFSVLLVVFIFSLSTLFSANGYVNYSGTGATANTAVLNVSFTSNGDTLSVGFSSTDPNSTSTDPNSTSGITPVTVVNLSSVLGFDRNGRRTVTGNATFYPYWQIQKNYPLKVVIRSTNLQCSDKTLSFTSNLNDSSNTEPKSTKELVSYSGDNSLVKGSIDVTVNTADASSFPYGTSFSGTVTLEVITT